MPGAVTVIVTLSVAVAKPSSTVRTKVSVTSASPMASVGAVKLGVALSSSSSATAGPAVWAQA